MTLRQTGHFLEKVHSPRKGAPRYQGFVIHTTCGRRGFTSPNAGDVTCKTCRARLTTVPALPTLYPYGRFPGDRS